MIAVPSRAALDAILDAPSVPLVASADRLTDPCDPAYRAAVLEEDHQQARRRGDAANERVRGLVERAYRAGSLEPPPYPVLPE